MIRRLATLLVLLLSPLTAHAADKLTIVKAGPVGEIADLAEANEIRVVFSEPMVALGKIPKVVGAPFFHLTPAVKGTFRWSGTTTLIFTPDPKMPLPFATKFDVAIDANATSVSGKTLDHAYEFSFVTPTIRLLNTNWYRKGGFDAPVVIALRFNQPVDANTIGPHLQLRTEGHELIEPAIPALERLKKLEPQSVAAFSAKVAAAHAAAASNGEAVISFFPADLAKKRF